MPRATINCQLWPSQSAEDSRPHSELIAYFMLGNSARALNASKDFQSLWEGAGRLRLVDMKAAKGISLKAEPMNSRRMIDLVE